MSPETIHLLEQVKDFIRQPYAWPGGYPMYLIMLDGGTLCHKCAKDNFKEIVRATMDKCPFEWIAYRGEVNWEDDQLYCDHCNVRIASAYS